MGTLKSERPCESGYILRDGAAMMETPRAHQRGQYAGEMTGQEQISTDTAKANKTFYRLEA